MLDELKNLNRWCKTLTFPEISSDKTAQVAKVIKQEIEEIKEEIKFEKTSDEMMLLGELLSHLRQQKSMTSLLLCRQIKNIVIENKTARILADDEVLNEISANEKCKTEISMFLEGKGLSLSVTIEQKQEGDLEKLKSLLGNKLQIN